jgi:hypothetical protein
MSVGDPRLAAAQRTAAHKSSRARRGRRLRLASWLLIVPMLSLFSFSVVAGARNVGKPDYASAVKQLPSNKPLILLKGGKQVLCAVSQGQADQLAARYRTGWTTMGVDGRNVRALWVDGPNEHEMRSFLGGSVDCKLVRQKSIFYLPFSADLS